MAGINLDSAIATSSMHVKIVGPLILMIFKDITRYFSNKMPVNLSKKK